MKEKWWRSGVNEKGAQLHFTYVVMAGCDTMRLLPRSDGGGGDGDDLESLCLLISFGTHLGKWRTITVQVKLRPLDLHNTEYNTYSVPSHIASGTATCSLPLALSARRRNPGAPSKRPPSPQLLSFSVLSGTASNGSNKQQCLHMQSCAYSTYFVKGFYYYMF